MLHLASIRDFVMVPIGDFAMAIVELAKLGM
jgi:hypothetical protein